MPYFNIFLSDFVLQGPFIEMFQAVLCNMLKRD